MDNYDDVIRQMEEFGVEFVTEKDRNFKFDTAKKVTFGKGGKYWYRLYLWRPDKGGEFITGSFGTYRHGGSWMKVDQHFQPMTDAERARQADKRAADHARAEEELRIEAAEAAITAADLLASAAREGQSAYLQRKQVDGESCRYLADGSIVIPLMRYDLPVDQRLQAAQRIYPGPRKHRRTGEDLPQKMFTKGFSKPGCCVRLGRLDEEPPALILVCEGYATGLTLRMATDKRLLVFVALDAGNLGPVVMLLHKLFRTTRILICADDDYLTRDRDTGELINPGRTAARTAAKLVAGCDFLWPQFRAATREVGDTDFNDLHVREGLDAVRKQLAGVVAAMERRYG